MADVNNVGKFGKNSGIDLNSIKGGLKKDALKTEEQKSIFDAVDTDKNGILDDNEVKTFKENLDTSQDGVISKKEAKKFLKSLNLNEVDQKELLKFLLDYSLNTEDVQEIRIKEENGQKLVEIVYKNGTTEVVNHDKSSVITSPPDEDGNITVSHFSPDKKLTKTSVTNAQGDVTDTEYLEDGETPATSVTNAKSGSISTITYEEGKPVTKQVKHGSVTSNYTYAEDGSEVLNSKIENEGVPAKERRTEYSYDENGVVTANITEFGKTTVQTIVDNKVKSETITEEGKTTVKEYNEDGTSVETITTAEGSETTVYNSENKRLSKTKVVDGEEYTIQYDGQGNTVGIIVENGESPALIAKRFGCDVNELLELNKAEVRGKGKGRYFRVAVEIKIPGEIEPDAKVLQGRQTKDEALAAYQVVADEIQAVKDEVAARKDITFTEKEFNTFEEIARNLFKQEGIENPSKRQLDARIADLKKDNPDLKDGELIGKTITAGVSQERFESIRAKEEAAEVAKQDAITQKESAKSIYKELMSAIDGWNDDDAIYKALKKIDNPTEMAEVNRLLAAKGYKADNYYSPVEKFMQSELGDSKSYDKSFDEMEALVKKWISNGALDGDNAINAQARLAARLIIDGCDGLGTDVDEAKEGVRLIKAPKPTGDPAVDNANAKKVYDQVEKIIKKHKSFGASFKGLKDYLKGDVTKAEIKYLDGILAQNDAIQGGQKADAIHDLIEEAVSGGGTNIDELKQALMAINSPEDRLAVEAQLKKYCEKKGIKPQIAGQDYLQAILYDECDTFFGVSTDHNEIRQFNEMMIEQGAYTEEEVQKLRAETAALQMLDGGLEDIQAAAGTIKDAETYAKLDALLKTKNYNGVEGFINKKFSSQVSRDSAMAIFASNNLLSNDKATNIATRLLRNSDFDTRALGLAAIRNGEVATAVNNALKQKGTSLESILKAFNEEKAEYKTKAAVWDSIAVVGGFLGLGSLAEHISDEYRENTDMSNNLYLESDTPVELSEAQIAAYEMTVKTLEDGLAQMKADYQAALDSQGVVSGAVNAFCSVYNLGTTRDEIEARIEHEEETVRLLTLASQGKLTKIVNGKTVPVTFEEVFTERQSAIVSANGVSLEALSAVSKKNSVNFDVAKVEKVANKAQTIVAMDFAKDNIAVCWSELEKGLKTNSNKELSIAIADTLQKLSEMSGKEMNLSSYGYEMKDGIIVDKSGKPVPAAKLKEIANQLKQGLSDVSQALFGMSIPANKSYDDVVDLLEDGYEDKMEAFKQEYRDAFGQEATDEMIENYISTINTGKMVVNIAGAIGAVVAAPFTGGGSLAVFVAAAGISMGLNALEHSTDADGYTNSEWTSDAEQALWDGALAAIGFKVGVGADKLVTQGFRKGSNLAKIANNLMDKNRALIQKFGPNLSKESVEKATIWLSRAEATFGEVSSDTVQSIVQSYCMEGELNMESFVSGMIMSVAGNAAGHTFSAFGDVKALKNGADIDPPAQRRTPVNGDGSIDVDPRAQVTNPDGVIDDVIDNADAGVVVSPDNISGGGINVANSPAAQSSKFVQTHRVDVGESVVDGYRDGGRGATFDLDGNIVDSSREIIVVDRTRDSKLQSIISDFKAKTSGMTDKQKAAFLQSYIHDMIGDGTHANNNLKAWEPERVGKEVLLGDIVTNNPPIAVCRHRSLLYKILGDEVGLKVELQRGNFYSAGDGGGHAWNTVRFDDGSSAIFDAMHNKTSVTTPGQVDDYAKNYFTVDDTPLYNDGLTPLQTPKAQADASVSSVPRDVNAHNPEINPSASGVHSAMDSMSETDIPPELKASWDNCKTKFREAVDLLEDLQPKAAAQKAKELASELAVVGKELTGIAKVKFNALMDRIENYFKTHNMSEIFADVKAKVNSATDAVVQSKAYKKSAEVLKDAYANIKAKDIPAKLKKVWEECGTHFDDLVKYVSSRDYSKAQSIAKALLVKLKNVSVSAGVALKAKLSKLIDDVGNWLKNSFSVSDVEAKAGFEFSPDAPRSSHSSIDMSSPKAHTNSILSSKNKDVQTDFLTGLKNEDGTPRFTPEQIKQIVNENPNGIVDSSVLYGLFKDVKTPEEFTNALDTLNAISNPSELKFVKNMLGLESVEIKTDGTFAFAGKNTNIDSLTLEEFLDVRRNSKLPEEDFDNYLKEFLTNPTYAKALVRDGGNISKVAIDAFAHFDNPYQLGAVHQFVTSAATVNDFIVPNWKMLCSGIKSVEDVTTIGKLLKSSRIDDADDFYNILRIYSDTLPHIKPDNMALAKEFLSILADTNFKATYCDDLFIAFDINQSNIHLQKDLILKYLRNEDFDRLGFVLQNCYEISPTSTNPLLRHVARTGEVPFDADNINSVIDSGLTPGFNFSYNQTQIRAIEHIIENYPNSRFEALGFREILENVKTEQDFNNLTKLLEYEDLDTFTLLQALKEGITDPKKIALLVKNTSNFDKALVKDLKTNYNLKSETCEKLAKLQTVSPTRYQKIVDSGLLDLIRDGKVSESILENVSATTFLSNRTLKDVRRLANGESLIPTIPKSEIEAISRHVANGDVCEVDGALFVNHNGKPVRLQITKEKFEELFPPLSSVSFAQGSVGDCWLISTLDNLMDLPAGRVQLYQMLRQEGDDIFVTFPGTGKSIKFANGDIAGAGTYLNNSHIANAPKGLQLIEQAYAVHRIKNSANLYADGEITDIQEILKSTDVTTLMKRLKSGTTTEAMTAISGVSNSRYFNIGSTPGQKRQALAKIQQVANRDDILISFSTHSNRLLGRAESTMSRQFDMVRSHAYSLKGYNPETGMVYITNPWHSQVVTEVPIHDFMKYADGFTITRLDGTPVRFDGNGILEDVVSSSDVDVNMGTVDVEAPVGGAFTDRLKRIFGGGSGNDVKAVMKNVTGPDGTPKYTKAQIDDLLEKSQVPISDDVLTEFLNFPVTAEIDFEIKQQVIQQLKSPEDVQMLSSLMKIAQSGVEYVDLNLAQIGDIIDLAKFNGKVSNPVEVFDKINTLLRNGKMDFPDSRDALVTLTDFLQSDEHKSFLMKLLNSFEQNDYKSSFWNYGGKLNSISAPLTIKNLNSLIEKYPNSFTPKYDGFNLFGGPTEYGVTSILDTINYADDVATFQVVLMNDLCRSGASIDRIVDVMSSLRMIGDMANVKNAPDVIDLMNRGASGRVIEFAIMENQPASIIDNPALKYLEANNYKIDYDNTHDVLTLLSADLSTPQKIQAFNDLLAAKDLGLQSVEITNIVSAIKTDADLARLKSMIDNGKVDTFKFIQDIKPATIDVDVPTTPEVKPISPETVKTPQEIRLDEIKRLNATYGIDVNHSAGLVELKINNPKRFAKIEESGLLDLIRDGKVDIGILRRLDMSENMFISNRTLAEIRRMVNGEPLVPTIPKSEIEAISKHVANGNVCEIDGALYVNDNGRPVKLKISKEIFEKYFPPLSNVAFRQGDIGDCWFVSTLENLMDKPAGRVAIYKLFEQQGDDILVRFPGSPNAVLFNKGLLAYNGHGPAIQVADGYDAMSPLAQPYGVQVLEQAYAVHRLKNGSRAYDVNSDITDINRLNDTKALLQRLHSGYEKEALGDLLGSGDIELTRNQAKMTQFIEERANDPNFVLEFGTKEKPGFKLESELDANYDLYSSHAYAIKGYNPETGMVYISNPWSTHTITEVPMYELTKHLDNMTCVDLRTVQRAGASASLDMTAVRNQIEGLEFVGRYDGEIRDELINKISIAVTQGAETNPKLIANRLEILKSGDMSLMSAIYENPQTATFKIDNHEALKEIEENLMDTFYWNTGFVIDATNADNIDRVQTLSRRVKAGDTDAINEIHYIQYSANPHKVVYGDTTVDVDSKMILSLLSGFRLGDNKSFDSEISKLFSTVVDMREKKAYGKSLAGILEQKPELVDIIQQTKEMNVTEYRAYVDKLIADGTIPENMSFRTFEPDPNEVEAATAIGAHIHMRKAEKYMGVDVSASSKGISTGDQHEGILDIFKKKKPITTTSIVEKLSPEFQNLRARLLSSEMPTTFDKAYFESWAKENGLTLQYESNGTVAKFVDDDGLVLRRITEDSTKPGMVYDDRVNVFDEKGALIGGKNTFSWDTRPLIYDVVDGHTANMVTLDAAGNWVSKETGLKVSYNPITGMESGMHGATSGIGSFGNTGTSRMRQATIQQQKDELFAQIDEQMDSVLDRMREIRRSTEASYDAKLERLQTRQAELDIEYNDYNVQTRATIEQKRAQMQGLLDDIHDEKKLLEILERQDRELEQQFLEYQSALGDLEKKLELFETSHGRDGGTIDELYNYAPEQRRRTIGAEHTSNLTEKVIPENAPAYFYDADLAELFHTYNITAPQNKAKVVAELREKLAEITRKYEKNTTRLDTCRENISSLETQRSGISSEVVELEAQQSQRRVDYRAEKESIAQDIEDAEALKLSEIKTPEYEALKSQMDELRNLHKEVSQIETQLEELGNQIYSLKVSYKKTHGYGADVTTTPEYQQLEAQYNGLIDRLYETDPKAITDQPTVDVVKPEPETVVKSEVSLETPKTVDDGSFGTLGDIILDGADDVKVASSYTPEQVLSADDLDVISRMRDIDDSVKPAVIEAYNEIGTRMSKGQLPSKDMMKQVVDDLAKKYGVEPEELLDSINDAMEKLDGWKYLARHRYFKLAAGREVDLDLITAFRIDKGLVSKAQLDASKDVLAELETRLINGEIPSSEMMGSVAQNIATKYGTTVDDVLPIVKGTISKSNIRRLAQYFEQSLDKNMKAMQDGLLPIDREIARLRETNAQATQVEVVAEAPRQPEIQSRQPQIQEHTSFADRFTRRQETRNEVRQEVQTPTQPQTQNNGIGSFGNTGIGSFGHVRSSMDTPVPTRKITEEEIYDEMDKILKRNKEITGEIQKSYDVKLERLQTRQSELDVEFNEYNVQTRATIEQKRAQMQDLFEQIHDEKRLLEVLERQDRQFEQQFLEYQSALGDLEKKLELFESSHGRDGGTIDELYNYAPEQRRRTIGAEHTSNLTEKVIPENAPAYFYDADLAELFHTYNITAPQNKAKVVAELREKLAEITRKYEKNTANLNTCRNNIEKMEAQRSGLSAEIVDLESSLTQRRTDYRTQKDAIAQDVETTTASREQAVVDAKNSPELTQNSARFKELQRQLRGEIPMEDVPIGPTRNLEMSDGEVSSVKGNVESTEVARTTASDEPISEATLNDYRNNVINNPKTIPAIKSYFEQLQDVNDVKHFIIHRNNYIKNATQKNLVFLNSFTTAKDFEVFNDLIELSKSAGFNPFSSAKFYARIKKNPAMAAKYQDMIELAKDGIIDPLMLRSYPNGTIDIRVARDVDILIKAKRQNLSTDQVKDLYIPRFDRMTKEQLNSIPTGGVIEYKGDLVIKIGDSKLQKINMSRDSYFELFPPAHYVKQQQAGKCYLYSTILTALENPRAKAKLLNQCFAEHDGVLTVKMPGSKVSFDVPLDNISGAVKTSPYYARGCTGVNLLEQAYEQNEVYIQSQRMIDYLTKKIAENDPSIDMEKAMTVLDDLIENPANPNYVLANSMALQHEGNFDINDIVTINESKDNSITQSMLSNADDLDNARLFYGIFEGDAGYSSSKFDFGFNPINPRSTAYKLYLKHPETGAELIPDAALLKTQDCLMVASTGRLTSGALESTIDSDFGILSSHAYACSLKMINDKPFMKLINPHNSACPILLTIEQFRKYFVSTTINKVM